ncbi:RHE_PE00001 family protein [Pinisolibacter aquiterrae]|uniref:RHE_PE00001 family protein n=1 Tax=Pinisolibacter aquiterrae TaxID=2815579 RepID=UPI001C3DD46D|nr:RHE_PE00001 family protein [Pinisolibacter aquiterrae]MBV5265384.1 DUF1612 and helix-turn-helix domain-containing protein [Pinisolibacter aquiterrae]MCC8235239.1 DUF1612 and helix-turn-helix domain-containing protein [Pinisolibacter aquiterrae]
MTSSRTRLPDPLPWPLLARPLARAEDALARLDERLRTSPIRDGWIARTHFGDAAAALWLDGELVVLEDLVLHDARLDVRAPTHELTRAHAVLGERRRIAGAEPDWALSDAGIAILRGRTAGDEGLTLNAGHEPDLRFGDEDDEGGPNAAGFDADAGGQALADAFAAVDAAIARSNRALAGEASRPPPHRDRDPLVYDLDWDEEARLTEWRNAVDRTRDLPPTLAAAIAHTAWTAIEPLQRAPGLGRLLAAALLRERGKARAHLPCLAEGAKAVPRERRRHRDASVRLVAELDAITAAAEEGMKQHDRWLTARTLLQRKLAGRRSTSRLPELIDLVISRPLVSAGMIAEALAVTPRAALDLVKDLDLRETTGRGRFRAWTVG